MSAGGPGLHVRRAGEPWSVHAVLRARAVSIRAYMSKKERYSPPFQLAYNPRNHSNFRLHLSATPGIHSSVCRQTTRNLGILGSIAVFTSSPPANLLPQPSTLTVRSLARRPEVSARARACPSRSRKKGAPITHSSRIITAFISSGLTSTRIMSDGTATRATFQH